MSWDRVTLTTALNTVDLSFAGRGAIYAEGTFGGGTVQIKLKTDDGVISTGFNWEIDGSSVKSADVPSGLYRIELAGSVGASVVVWRNAQVDLIRDS